jgi:drug/metabolite transporter (DMT)-like permease
VIRRHDGPALAALGLALAVFAPSFAATRVAADGLGVGTVTGIRLLLGGGALCLLAAPAVVGLRPALRRLLWLGAYGMGLQTLFLCIGVDAGTASLGALILGLEPVGIALVGALAARQLPTHSTVAGLALGLAGVVAVSGVVSVGVSGTPLRAVLALLGTTACFSVYAVRLKRELTPENAVAVTGLTMVGGGLAVLPLVVAELALGKTVQADADVWTAVGAGYLVLCQTVIGYVAFSRALAHLSADVVAVLLYLLPPLSVLAAWALLGETPHVRDAVGGALILVGVAVASRRPRPAHRLAEETPC